MGLRKIVMSALVAGITACTTPQSKSPHIPYDPYDISQAHLKMEELLVEFYKAEYDNIEKQFQGFKIGNGYFIIPWHVFGIREDRQKEMAGLGPGYDSRTIINNYIAMDRNGKAYFLDEKSFCGVESIDAAIIREKNPQDKDIYLKAASPKEEDHVILMSIEEGGILYRYGKVKILAEGKKFKVNGVNTSINNVFETGIRGKIGDSGSWLLDNNGHLVGMVIYGQGPKGSYRKENLGAISSVNFKLLSQKCNIDIRIK